LVETAFILPILVLFMLATVDFGRMFYYQIVITNAAREGARIAANPGGADPNSACAAAAAPLSVSCSWSGTRTSGNTVRMNVTYSFSWMTPLPTIMSRFGIGLSNPFVIRASAAMVVL